MTANCCVDHHPEPHSHPEHPDPVERSSAIKRVWWNLWIALALVLIEIVGSWYSNSLALLADAFHITGDVAAVGITLIASYLAERPQSPTRSYGYYRLEVLAALFNGLSLAFLSFFVFYRAYARWAEPYTMQSGIMLAVAVLGFAANSVMLSVLKPAHSHNLNLRAAYLHILGDTISSVVVIAGAIFIALTGWVKFDSLASIIVSAIILVMAIRLILDSAHVLLEGTPKHMDPLEIESSLKKEFPQIVNIHDFHVWEITAHLFAMTAHIEANVQDLSDTRNLIDNMNLMIQKKYGIGHTTFQVEPNSI